MKRHVSPGFTLVELLVVMAISIVLFGLISINLGQTQTSSSLASVTDTLLSDIKRQQLDAMAGSVGSASSQQPQGIYVQSSSYTLFAGSSYSASDGNNFVVNAPTNVTFGTSFGSSQVVFGKGSGEVQGFSGTNNTITVTTTGGTRTITVGRLGAVSTT